MWYAMVATGPNHSRGKGGRGAGPVPSPAARGTVKGVGEAAIDTLYGSETFPPPPPPSRLDWEFC